MSGRALGVRASLQARRVTQAQYYTNVMSRGDSWEAWGLFCAHKGWEPEGLGARHIGWEPKGLEPKSKLREQLSSLMALRR